MRSLIDLEAELADVLARIAAATEEIKARKQRRGEAVAKIEQLMREFQLTVEDIESPVRLFTAKYRDKTTGNAWSGNGALPSWLKAAINDGRKLEEFAVSPGHQ